MRFHVIGLPHTNTTRDYSWCAFTTKVRRFCDMMTGLGHDVILYAGDRTDTKQAELVTCVFPENDPEHIPVFDHASPIFRTFAHKVIAEMIPRIEPRDFICIIGGVSQKVIADSCPDNMAVEYGIGYEGIFAPYRVFESYAWMHMLYGASGRPHACDGRFMTDAVIPNYFELDDFPVEDRQNVGEHYLYLGRIIDRKGWRIAVDVCRELDKPLILAGPGDPGELPDNVTHVGVVGEKERADLLARAIATFTPSLYVEPFCGVAVESMLCGTPVITTDWGAFTETVTPAVTGYRCRTFAEFCDAALAAPELNRGLIAGMAGSRYSTDDIALRYEAYFDRLMTLWSDGFYAPRSILSP